MPPRKMLDLESQGMLLFSKDSQGKMALIMTSEIVENGTRVT
ncbi:hypothetical protein KAW80_00885 [Candidatus Babeliales bacterium]|nr:hypothetical protein [Candidatus Babeliales bacterium]